MNIIPYTEEHKEQPVAEQNAFKLRIAAERKAEEEELKSRQEKEKLMREGKVEKTKAPKPKRKYKKKKSKKEKKVDAKPLMSLKILPIKKEIKLPFYKTKIEVNEFNKFKVDYIKKQAFLCKDPERKMIYKNALLKYNMDDYEKLRFFKN